MPHLSIAFGRSKRFTLHPLADLFVPTPTRLGKHSATLQLLCEDYSFKFAPVYTFIQLSELGCCGEYENAQYSKQLQRGIKSSLSIKSDILPLSYRAQQFNVVTYEISRIPSVQDKGIQCNGQLSRLFR